MTRNRNMLLKEIQQLGFRMYDLGLFLDTHPSEEKALSLYNSTLNKYKTMVANFEKLYGPLNWQSEELGCNQWKWLEGPWPWEIQCCEEECN